MDPVEPTEQEPTPETEAPPEMEASPQEPPEPAPKRRGRPPGSKNRPKIAVVPIQDEAPPPPVAESQPEAESPDSEAEPEPKPQRAPRPSRTRVAMVAPPPPQDMHHTLMAYMANYVREQSRNEHQRKIDFYSNLINGRVA